MKFLFWLDTDQVSGQLPECCLNSVTDPEQLYAPIHGDDFNSNQQDQEYTTWTMDTNLYNKNSNLLDKMFSVFGLDGIRFYLFQWNPFN